MAVRLNTMHQRIRIVLVLVASVALTALWGCGAPPYRECRLQDIEPAADFVGLRLPVKNSSLKVATRRYRGVRSIIGTFLGSEDEVCEFWSVFGEEKSPIYLRHPWGESRTEGATDIAWWSVDTVESAGVRDMSSSERNWSLRVSVQGAEAAQRRVFFELDIDGSL